MSHWIGSPKRYGTTVTADTISLDIAEKEFITLLGPSDSGKTTTQMVVARFVCPDGGHQGIEDRDITQTPQYKRNISMVFQNYALFPHHECF